MTSTATPEGNKQIVRRLTETLNKRNFDSLDEILDKTSSTTLHSGRRKAPKQSKN